MPSRIGWIAGQRDTIVAAQAIEDKTEQELDARKAEAYKQGDDLVAFTLVQREFEQNRTLYEGLKQRLGTAKVQAGLDSLEVDLVDQARFLLDQPCRPPVDDHYHQHHSSA